MKLRVQQRMCATCIFRAGSSLNLADLLDAVREEPPVNWRPTPEEPKWPWFKGHRVCHHSEDAVCAGFWAHAKDRFQLGQLAQRMGRVEFVNDDNQGESMSAKTERKHARRKARQRGEAPPGYPSSTVMLATLNGLKPISEEEFALMQNRQRIAKMEAWRSAADAANGRLEPKQYENGERVTVQHSLAFSAPLTSTRPIPSQPRNAAAALRAYSPSRAKAHDREVLVPHVEIAEADFLLALKEAREAGRTSFTPESLAELLAQPHPVSYLNQRGFAKWL